MINDLWANCAFVDSNLMAGVGHTIDFPNRNQILGDAYQWIDSVNLSSINGGFGLVEPINFGSITSKGFNDYVHRFSWNKSPVQDSCGVLKYEVLFDLPSGNFSNPILTLSSDNGGTDTTLSFTNFQLDSLLASFLVPINSSMIVDWTVRSNINNIHSDTAKSFNLTMTRKKLGFALSTPSNNRVVTLTNGGSQFFDWEDINHYIGVDYYLHFDDTAADFSNPILSYISSGSGSSSSLGRSHEQLYFDLMFRGEKEIGDSTVVLWNASAEDSVYFELASNERTITFIRGQVGMDLFSPVDGSIIKSEKGTNYVFNWDSVLLSDITYEWRFDTLGVDLQDTTVSFILGSNDNAANNEIDVTFDILDSMMNFYGVEYFDTLRGQWTVKAMHSGGSEYALSTWDVTIVREHPIGIEENNNANGISVYPNPAGNEVTFAWNESGRNALLEIHDASGAAVLRKNLSSGRNKVDVSSLSEGSYVWHLLDEDKHGSGLLLISR